MSKLLDIIGGIAGAIFVATVFMIGLMLLLCGLGLVTMATIDVYTQLLARL